MVKKIERQIPYAIVAETEEYARNWTRSGKVWNLQIQKENGKFQTEHLTILCALKQNGKTVQQITTVKNRVDKPVVLEQVSSAYIAGIGLGGIRPWYDEERFKLYFVGCVGREKASGATVHYQNWDFTGLQTIIPPMRLLFRPSGI